MSRIIPIIVGVIVLMVCLKVVATIFKDSDLGVFGMWIVVLLIVGAFLASMAYSGEKVDEIKEKISDVKVKSEIPKEINKNLATYQLAKEESKYFSDEFLINSLREEFLDINERIAYKEVLVERGVWDYSPTKQKMALIKRRFNSE